MKPLPIILSVVQTQEALLGLVGKMYSKI